MGFVALELSRVACAIVVAAAIFLHVHSLSGACPRRAIDHLVFVVLKTKTVELASLTRVINTRSSLCSRNCRSTPVYQRRTQDCKLICCLGTPGHTAAFYSHTSMQVACNETIEAVCSVLSAVRICTYKSLLSHAHELSACKGALACYLVTRLMFADSFTLHNTTGAVEACKGYSILDAVSCGGQHPEILNMLCTAQDVVSLDTRCSASLRTKHHVYHTRAKHLEYNGQHQQTNPFSDQKKCRIQLCCSSILNWMVVGCNPNLHV